MQSSDLLSDALHKLVDALLTNLDNTESIIEEIASFLTQHDNEILDKEIVDALDIIKNFLEEKFLEEKYPELYQYIKTKNTIELREQERTDAFHELQNNFVKIEQLITSHPDYKKETIYIRFLNMMSDSYISQNIRPLFTKSVFDLMEMQKSRLYGEKHITEYFNKLRGFCFDSKSFNLIYSCGLEGFENEFIDIIKAFPDDNEKAEAVSVMLTGKVNEKSTRIELIALGLSLADTYPNIKKQLSNTRNIAEDDMLEARNLFEAEYKSSWTKYAQDNISLLMQSQYK